MEFSQIHELVQQGANERVLQTALKSDLSLLGRALVHPAIPDEYIAFSEYPIGEGKADFVVLTDRSRMDVIIVEIKGADFAFVTEKGVVSSVINFATQQVRERRHYIRSNYDGFRRKVHLDRMAIESGEVRYNSVLGANGFLHVDPNKDIDVRGVVIGGRTKKDLEESRLRHQMEVEYSGVRFESWDSWLRKLL